MAALERDELIERRVKAARRRYRSAAIAVATGLPGALRLLDQAEEALERALVAKQTPEGAT